MSATGAVPHVGVPDRGALAEAAGCGLLLPGAPQAAANAPTATTSAAVDLPGRTRRAMCLSFAAGTRGNGIPQLLNRVSAR
ncbi:hypothetical protein GCM10023259_053390 [Thermocatellispora tengchongensis]